jgi:hypothetical protein
MWFKVCKKWDMNVLKATLPYHPPFFSSHRSSVSLSFCTFYILIIKEKQILLHVGCGPLNAYVTFLIFFPLSIIF